MPVTKYSSAWQEGDECTYVAVFCPQCNYLNETTWDSLERGAHHKCEKCNHEWIIEEVESV